MSRKGGIEFFPLEVGMIDNDDKIYALMSEYSGTSKRFDEQAWAAYGRFITLLSQIYAEGWFIQFDNLKHKRIAHKLGYEIEDDLDLFIDCCVRLGLFYAPFYEQDRVLTSRGIQRRYQQAKKRTKGIITGPWALLDDLSQNADNCAPHESSNNTHADTCAKSVPQEEEKRREEKEELKEEEEDKASSSSSDVENFSRPLQCMMHAIPNKVYCDSNDIRYTRPYAALRSSYEAVSARQDFPEFAQKVSTLCPKKCRGDPEQVCECLEHILRALHKFDPTKSSDPWLLTEKVLEQDRAWRIPHV